MRVGVGVGVDVLLRRPRFDGVSSMHDSPAFVRLRVRVPCGGAVLVFAAFLISCFLFAACSLIVTDEKLRATPGADTSFCCVLTPRRGWNTALPACQAATQVTAFCTPALLVHALFNVPFPNQC